MDGNRFVYDRISYFTAFSHLSEHVLGTRPQAPRINLGLIGLGWFLFEWLFVVITLPGCFLTNTVETVCTASEDPRI